MKHEIRRIHANDWQELRSLRLSALAETPTAYGSSLARELEFTNNVWRERAHGAASGCTRATFIAEDKRGWIGIATGLSEVFSEEEVVPLLVSMHVAPSARRKGIGMALIGAVTSWARSCGAGRIALWVTSDNQSAITLYRRCAFCFTGKVRTHSRCTDLVEEEMVQKFR
ncbi:MAG: GNAT family N-acetyltransferase [Hyphomicrobiaceae bacterium]